MTELERARELARGSLATLEANRRRIDDLNVYPGAGRRHGNQPDPHRAGDRRVAGSLDRSRPRGRGEGADARRADGRAGKLGGDLLPDRPRCRRGAGRAGNDRCDPDLPRLSRRERCRLSRCAPTRRGNDAVRDPGARRGGGEPDPLRPAGSRALPRARRARREGARPHARAAGRAPRGGCRRCRRRRPARDRARHLGDPRRRARAGGARRGCPRSGNRRDPPGALGLPLLHGLRRRGRGARCRRARDGARAAR